MPTVDAFTPTEFKFNRRADFILNITTSGGDIDGATNVKFNIYRNKAAFEDGTTGALYSKTITDGAEGNDWDANTVVVIIDKTNLTAATIPQSTYCALEYTDDGQDYILVQGRGIFT